MVLKMTQILLITFTIAGCFAFEGLDLDLDGQLDFYEIEINGIYHLCDKCVTQDLHATNNHYDSGDIELCNN